MTALAAGIVAAVLMLLLGALPAAAASPVVVVASKIDTEGALLGNMILSVLSAHGISVRKELARQAHLATMSDFARYVNRGGDLKLAASAEFVESPSALPAFEASY